MLCDYEKADQFIRWLTPKWWEITAWRGHTTVTQQASLAAQAESDVSVRYYRLEIASCVVSFASRCDDTWTIPPPTENITIPSGLRGKIWSRARDRIYRPLELAGLTVKPFCLQQLPPGWLKMAHMKLQDMINIVTGRENEHDERPSDRP